VGPGAGLDVSGYEKIFSDWDPKSCPSSPRRSRYTDYVTPAPNLCFYFPVFEWELLGMFSSRTIPTQSLIVRTLCRSSGNGLVSASLEEANISRILDNFNFF
jgi:hypothetical protein